MSPRTMAPDTNETPTREAVLRIAAQVVGAEALPEALRVLDTYGTEPWHRERERVQLAILKLLDEDPRNNLAELVDIAREDYRDVLAWAESPHTWRVSPDAPGAEHRRSSELDAAQHRAWLLRFR